MRIKFILVLVALALVAAGCGDDDDATTTTAAAAGDTTTTAAAETTTTAAAAACAVESLELITPGTLTVATGEPAFPPWGGSGDDATFDVPESGTGFEAAVVYEIAKRLGFGEEQVVWVRTGFDEAVAPGPKPFDFNIQQYSINDERDQVVDFSVPYYVTSQALLVLDGSPFQNATTLGELKDAKLGAAIGTTSVAFIESVIQPTTPPNVYDENFDVVSAMNAGQIEGIVVDLGTAFYLSGSGDVPNSVVAASFEAEAADEYGLLFADGNPLVECVNEAINALWADGTIDGLIADWLQDAAGVTVISE